MHWNNPALQVMLAMLTQKPVSDIVNTPVWWTEDTDKVDVDYGLG